MSPRTLLVFSIFVYNTHTCTCAQVQHNCLCFAQSSSFSSLSFTFFHFLFLNMLDLKAVLFCSLYSVSQQNIQAEHPLFSKFTNTFHLYTFQIPSCRQINDLWFCGQMLDLHLFIDIHTLYRCSQYLPVHLTLDHK